MRWLDCVLKQHHEGCFWGRSYNLSDFTHNLMLFHAKMEFLRGQKGIQTRHMAQTYTIGFTRESGSARKAQVLYEEITGKNTKDGLTTAVRNARNSESDGLSHNDYLD